MASQLARRCRQELRGIEIIWAGLPRRNLQHLSRFVGRIRGLSLEAMSGGDKEKRPGAEAKSRPQLKKRPFFHSNGLGFPNKCSVRNVHMYMF